MAGLLGGRGDVLPLRHGAGADPPHAGPPLPLGQVLQSNIWLYGLYGGLAAGIFEEVGRFLAFKLVLRNRRERITALSYGLGHGGIEAFLLLAVTYFNNLYLFSVLSNGGTLAPELTAALENLAALPAVMYLWAGLERVIAITIHMALSLSLIHI